MRKAKFKKHIEKLGEEDLRDELFRLYEKLKTVREYYRMDLGSKDERARLYLTAKKNIAAKYKTRSRRKPRRPRIQKVRKILSELEKLSVFGHELIDVYLFDVETAIGFARSYDYFTQVLFNNITNSFKKACRLIEQNSIWDDYTTRCEELIEKSLYIKELHDHLKNIMSTHFETRE